MLSPEALPALHAALAALDDPVDGWLLFDFRGINPIMSAVVGRDVVGSRRAYVWIPRAGTPVALVHGVDAELWRDWPAPWRRIVWVRREQLARELSALVGGRTVAMEYSPGGAVPYGDYIPAGTLELVRSAGATPVSSAELVTRYCSAWTPADLASHRRAAAAVAGIARAGLALVAERARTPAPVTEHELTAWVLEAFERAGLVTESAPSVSYGDHAARAHYEAPAEGSAAIVPGALLLFDLWAKEPGGVYADQTWMAAVGAPSARAVELWTVVCTARDAALDLLRDRLTSGRPVTGAEADRAARGVIDAAGYGDRIVSRTGHSIDRVGLHGYGPTIDDTESFDTRRILPGAGFSVEPGIYLPGEIGLRSEVNAHARTDGLDVTPEDY
ncbi:MAG TPA: M24 family metallopeptidase, partial [Gemmatimonadales bacterium]|nr:M24 family metallopeptidase [Gemmatimonadales bacterium]